MRVSVLGRCPVAVESSLAVPLYAADDPGLPAAVPAGAGGGFQEAGEGYFLTLVLSRIVLLQRES